MFTNSLWNISTSSIKDVSVPDTRTHHHQLPMLASQHKHGIMQNFLAKLPLAEWLPPSNGSDSSPEHKSLPFIPTSSGCGEVPLQESGRSDASLNGSETKDNLGGGDSPLLAERETSEEPALAPPEISQIYCGDKISNYQSHIDSFPRNPHLQVSTVNTHVAESSPFTSRFISMVMIDHGTPPASPASETSNQGFGSSSSSLLVPTEITSHSRPPVAMPDFRMAQAQTHGIKIRDFAYENHGVPTAPVVDSITQTKARYELYRSTRLDPPRDIIEDLEYLDKAWLDDAERRYREDPTQFERKSEPPILEWRRANAEKLRAKSVHPRQSDSPSDRAHS